MAESRRGPAPPATELDVARRPILILGMTHRCGSNLLWKLLELHPDCALSPIREDFVLHHSDKLAEFAGAVGDEWKRYASKPTERLLARLGDALIDELSADPTHRPVVKTPSVCNLDLVFELFPSARVLLLVRDGRDVVESGMMGFGWDFESATLSWARAARTVSSFVQNQKAKQDRFRIVRFEELWSDRRRVVRQILETAALDPSSYDFESADRLPVFGSSELLRPDSARPDWDGVAMPPDFRPTGRWGSWSARRQRRFAWLAGDAMHSLGYAGGSDRFGPAGTMFQRTCDARAAARELLQRIKTAASKPKHRRNAG